VTPIQDGELLPDGEILQSQFRTQLPMRTLSGTG
jgi:hypothetical protein